LIRSKFTGRIKKGKLLLEDEEAFQKNLALMEGKEVILSIRELQKERSRQEEKYYHGVVVEMIADTMSIQHDEAHDFLRSLFLKTEESCILQDGTVLRYERIRSTTELDDKEYREYWNKCVNWAALPTEDGLNINSGLGLIIPLPHEVDYD